MDFKGVTWAGNIYQKFEAMCLEVEEVMYEDTVKYVENQVQKVGVSVKKFYSEVMQDLLPPSCVDPVKVSAGDLSLNPYAHTDINKKSNLSILGSHGELTQKKTEDEDISDQTAKASHLSVLNGGNHLSPPSPTLLVENTCFDVYSTKSKKVGVYKRPIGIKRISQNSRPPKISRPVSSLSGDRSGCRVAASSELFVRRDPEEAMNKSTPISGAPFESVSSDKNVSAESVRQETDNSECTSTASDKISSAECLMQKKDDSECTPSSPCLPTEPIGTSMKDVSFSQSGSGFGNNACEVESVGQDIVTSDEDKFRKNGSFSQISSDVRNDTLDIESANEEVVVPYEDNFDMEVIKNEEVADPRAHILEPVKRSNLEETCILVDGDELHSVPQGTQKHKSYKKKIREALKSKLRSTKKQDQCVLGGKKAATEARTMDPSNHDSLESEWELL